MSGHNKWSKIKHKKAAGDAQKSKVFGKLARLITLESKRAGGSVSAPALRTLIDKARKANMPSENIERAIEKGRGGDGSALERVLYEGYGPGGVALVIDAVTDNRNRTAQEIKFLLGEYGASLAAPGSALWGFEKTVEGYVPKAMVTLTPEDTKRLEDLLTALEDHDDVEEVFENAT
jgi:YebC/PmpR family DNA-binding regulatory protein